MRKYVESFRRLVSIPSTITILLTGGGFAAAYALLSQLGWLTVIDSTGYRVILPQKGLLLAAFLLSQRSRRLTIAVIAGLIELAMNQWHGLHPLLNLAMTCGTQLEAGLATNLLVRRRGTRFFRDGDLADALEFGALAVCALPALGAVLYAIPSTLLQDTSFLVAWRCTMAAGSVGILLVTPALLTVPARKRPQPFPWPRRFEAAVVLVGTVCVGYAAFGQGVVGTQFTLPLGYLPFPFLIWSAIRFGLRGAAWTTVILAALSTSLTMGGYGPFGFVVDGNHTAPAITSTFPQDVFWLQLYLAVAALSAIPLAIIVNERDRSSIALAVAIQDQQASAAWLDVVFANAPIGLAFNDCDLRFLHINESLAATNGRSVAEHLGKHIRDVIPDLAEIVEENYNRVIQTGEPVLDVEVIGETPAQPGETREWLASYYPVRTPAGKMLGMGCVVNEVTERRRSQKIRLRLEAEREGLLSRLQTTFDSMPIGCIVFDSELRFRYCNPTAEVIFGHTFAELKGTHPFENIVPQEEFEELESLLNDVRTANLSADHVNVNLTKDGRTILCQWHNTPLHGSDGSFDGILSMCQDITERVQAEEALRESENRFRAFMENNPAVAFIKNASGRYIYGNLAWARQFGSQRAELLGKQDGDLWPPTTAAIFGKSDEMVLSLGKTLLAEESVQNRRGEYSWWSTFKFPIARQGKESLVGCVALNITDRKVAELALEASEQRFRTLVQATTSIIWSADAQGHFAEPQSSWAQYTGQEWEQQAGVGWTEMFEPGDRERIAEEWSEVVSKPANFCFEGRLWHADSSTYRHFVGRAIPIRNEDGSVREWIGTTTDVDDRRRAESALARSSAELAEWKNRYEAAILASNHVFFDWDTATNRCFWGGTIEQTLGYPAEEREETLEWWIDLIHVDDRHAFIDEIKRVLATGEAANLEYRIRHRGGDYVTVEDHGVFVRDLVGDKPRMVGFVTDISDRKVAQQQREELISQLENKNAELERFTYTVSHDLKSPLITIKGFLGMLEQDALAGNQEELRNDIARIAAAADRMKRLLDELLELSRIGRIMNPAEEISMGELFEEVVSEVTESLCQSNDIQVDIAANLPAVWGDRVRLHEALQNLIENAIRFMSEQSDPRLEIGLRSKQTPPVFYIRDNGVGISPRYLERIFGLFEQLDPQKGGTGIGLAIVKRIIEVHGGRIWAESEGVGCGTTFCFTFPLRGPVD